MSDLKIYMRSRQGDAPEHNVPERRDRDGHPIEPQPLTTVGETPLKVLGPEDGAPEPPPHFVEVPGFGILVVGQRDNAWFAEVFRPPSTSGISREVRVIDGRVEVAMLHKFDRLDVVLEGIT